MWHDFVAPLTPAGIDPDFVDGPVKSAGFSPNPYCTGGAPVEPKD